MEFQTVSHVESAMNAIKYFDCQPPVFKVFLMASDTLQGFDAWADFRSWGDCSSVSAHGETPEEALEKLHNVLKQSFSKCPACGGTGRAK